MKNFNLFTKLLIYPIYILIHKNIIFGFIQKNILKKFKYKKFYFSLKQINLPTASYSSFFFNTYEINDRVLVEKYIDYKNKIILIGGGIGFIATIAYHLSRNQIYIFEINKKLIELIKVNLVKNKAKFKLFNYNLVLNKKYKNQTYFISENFLGNSIYRKTSNKSYFKNLNYKKIKNFEKFNTLIIDAEGAEKEYIIDINKLKNIKYLFLEFHNDILFNQKKKLFKILKNNNFKLIDSFFNSFYFKKNV